MRHFISFQKKKALYLERGDCAHETLAHELNHELMAHGFVLSKPCFDVLATLSIEALGKVHADLTRGLRRVVGDADGYEPIYQGFPQSVLALTYEEFAFNALAHYWTAGQWRPEDAEYLKREFKLEATSYREVSLMTQTQFQAIFDDLFYGEVSLSGFDKECVDWYLDEGMDVALGRIRFFETASYVGQRLLDDAGVRVLPITRATTVLRIWAAYSGGDEGLKEATRFKSPSVRQRAVLLATLDACNDLEDSFKSNRGPWLRVLHYLHPGTAVNRERFPTVAEYADRLRNRPKTLKTFNARVTALLEAKDPALFELLKRRPGAYMRRLDHLVRTFGVEAVYQWLELDVSFSQLVTAYNHFAGRGVAQSGRAAVLAGQGASELVTYKALEPLDAALVEHITGLFLERLRAFSAPELAGRAISIDPSLYMTPLATNNRASSLSLDGTPIGKCEVYEAKETLRLYVHWHGKHDIDLSGFLLSRTNEIIKIGWNGRHLAGTHVVYSGDNTGYADKNAEYLDVNTSELPEDIEWVIAEARIYRGPSSYAGFNGKVHAGWMSRKNPEANAHWTPNQLEHAMVLQSKSRTAYLMAYHAPTSRVVYLDMAMGDAIVSTASDAIKMRIFLDRIIGAQTSNEIRWDRLQQGHLLELLAGSVSEDADITFDENTTSEQVSRLMTTATRG